MPACRRQRKALVGDVVRSIFERMPTYEVPSFNVQVRRVSGEILDNIDSRLAYITRGDPRSSEKAKTVESLETRAFDAA
jgi:hypothetical protein